MSRQEQDLMEKLDTFFKKELEAKAMATYLRQGAFEITIRTLESEDVPSPRLKDIVYYLHTLAEELDPQGLFD